MGAAATEKKILVLEDDADTVRLLEMVLGGAGYTNLRTVQDAREAESVFESFVPDLVLMDLHMPHIDGMRLLGTMAGSGGTRVVVMTGDISRETQNAAERAGAVAFVNKPYDISQVVALVGEQLGAGTGG